MLGIAEDGESSIIVAEFENTLENNVPAKRTMLPCDLKVSDFSLN